MNILSTERYYSRRSPVLTTGGVVATSQSLASAAGAEILARGGSAADAAVAAAAALQVTQPCSTGLGGDCFCLYFEPAGRKVYALNGSGRSPEHLDLDLLAARGYREELPPHHALTVTVPGAPSGWCDVLRRFGRLDRGTVLAPAIRLAEQGFPVAPMAAKWWHGGAEAQLSKTTHGAELLTSAGTAPRAGEVFANPTLAASLRTLADEGSDPFYRGRIAERIVAAVSEAGGVLSEADLEAHTSTWVDPISVDYRGVRVWECPPNGQGLAALIALSVVSNADFERCSEPDAERLHLLIEAMRVGFADAGRYVADPGFADIPLSELLSPAYGRSRWEEIRTDRRAEAFAPGRFTPPAAGEDTVYLCAVDADGNACSFINSNYMGFGTGIVPGGCGYSIQNRGHNFSLDPAHPNRVEPRKRPYHTIIPGLATRTKDDTLYAAFGVMGGFMQPQGHLQVLSALVDDELDPQAALDRPRFQVAGRAPGGAVRLEAGVSNATTAALEGRGHEVEIVTGSARSAFGLGQIILDTGEGVRWAGSDPRGDGAAIAAQ